MAITSYKPYTSYRSYERLIVYWLGATILDLTEIFTDRYISSRRRKEQMDEAARSGKQNIVEGWLERSFESQIKLLSVGRASYGELKEDFFDFLRKMCLPVWPKDNPKVLEIRRTIDLPGMTYKSYKTYTSYLGTSEEFANLMITLCSKQSFLLDRLIKSTEEKFIKEGGFRENLLKKRLAFRNQQKN